MVPENLLSFRWTFWRTRPKLAVNSSSGIVPPRSVLLKDNVIRFKRPSSVGRVPDTDVSLKSSVCKFFKVPTDVDSVPAIWYPLVKVYVEQTKVKSKQDIRVRQNHLEHMFYPATYIIFAQVKVFEACHPEDIFRNCTWQQITSEMKDPTLKKPNFSWQSACQQVLVQIEDSRNTAKDLCWDSPCQSIHGQVEHRKSVDLLGKKCWNRSSQSISLHCKFP